MEIQNSSIAMFSNRTYLEKYEKSESLKMWVGNVRPDFEGKDQAAGRSLAEQVPKPKDYIVDLSVKAKEAQPAQKNGIIDGELSGEDQIKVKLIEKLLEALTGKKIKIKILVKLKECGEECAELKGKVSDLQNQQKQGQAPERQGWGIEYDYHEFHYEHEETSLSAEGIIKTEDGKEINFSVNINMSREFVQEQNIHIRAGDASKIDPLVINYSGLAAELTDTKFSFDLDSDGNKDNISFVSPGSGFLAIDKNNDQIINNGSELFGPSSGNGFADLAQYNEDGNQWIDENDSIFDKLRIWSKDAQGNDYLFALGQKGIGALYLGNLNTQFAVKNDANEVQGEVKSTGLYVKENGTVGTVQQLDLTI
jgi:hypothetical protein